MKAGNSIILGDLSNMHQNCCYVSVI